MNEFQVTCINKPERASTHEHITHIGNMTDGWKLTRDEAIRRIESRSEAFYTIDKLSGARVYVGVVHPTHGHAYLRTYADGSWNDNLLALAECGASCNVVG